MTAPALIRKPDMLRAAQIANETGCRLEIKVGDAVITVIPAIPASPVDAPTERGAGVEYRRPQL